MTRFFVIYSLIASSLVNRSIQIAMLKSKTGTALVLLSIIFVISLGYLASFTFPYLSKQSSLFNVDARSEFVSISPFKGARYPQWQLDNVDLHDGCGAEKTIVNGTLNILPVTTIDMERVEKSNLTITLSTPNFEDSAIITSNDGFERKLSDCATLLFETSGQSYIFPIDGEITLGHQIPENTTRPPVLKSGTVYVADKRILDENYYQNTPFHLRMGDRFLVRNALTQASGFVFVDNQGELDISYRVKGKAGIIQKYKSEPIIVANSFWSKLVNDDLLAIFWLFILTLFGIIKSLFLLKWNNARIKNNHF